MDPAIYELNPISDDPRFEGFAFAGDPPSRLGRDSLDEDFYPAWGGKWAVTSLAKKWKPVEVTGRVRPFNDFPCVELTPAFSRRAVDVLGDFLRPNGELLPLKSKVGEYYAYNLHTVADILDKKKSTVTRWASPILADHVSHVVLKRKTLGKLSIFYLREKPDCALVTNLFVERVRQPRAERLRFPESMAATKGDRLANGVCETAEKAVEDSCQRKICGYQRQYRRLVSHHGSPVSICGREKADCRNTG